MSSFNSTDVDKQVESVMDEIETHLKSVKLTWDHVTDSQVRFLFDGGSGPFNEPYNRVLGEKGASHCPTRTAYQALGIAGQKQGALFEIMVEASALPAVQLEGLAAMNAAPRTSGFPFSPVRRSGNEVWFAGKIGMIGAEGIENQTKGALVDFREILDAAQLSPKDIVATDIIMTSFDHVDFVRREVSNFISPLSKGYQPMSFTQPGSVPGGVELEITFRMLAPMGQAFVV